MAAILKKWISRHNTAADRPITKKFGRQVYNDDFLFQEGVIGEEDMHKLQMQTDPRQQCRSLLTLLHMSEHPQAFVQLYVAIKAESHLQWLIDRIDKFTDQSVISLLQEMYISEPTGFEMTVHWL